MDADDKPIILINTKTKQIANCLICNVPLEVVNYNEDTKSDLVLECSKCQRNYFPGSEVMHYEDVLVGPQDDYPAELTGVGDANTSIYFSDDNVNTQEEDKKSGFYSMDYLVKEPGKKIVHLQEIIPTEDNNNNNNNNKK